jgi:hypothetical protein
MLPSITLRARLWELPIDVIPIHDIDHATVAGSLEQAPAARMCAADGTRVDAVSIAGDH